MKKYLILVIALSYLFFPSISMAHPGRTDAYGCHTCRTNCAKWGLSTGEYHCHQAKALPQPKEPIKSHKTDTGTGFTTPAPEYKQPATPTSQKIDVTQKEEPKMQNIQSEINTQSKESWIKKLFKLLFN